MKKQKIKDIIENIIQKNKDAEKLFDENFMNKLKDENDDVDDESLTELLEKLKDCITANQWSEFNDREFANWKRIRNAIEHENTLINHRLTWLLSGQTVLITAYTLGFNQLSQLNISLNQSKVTASPYPGILIILAVLGIVISLVLHKMLKLADVQLIRLERWYYGNRDWELLEKNEQLTWGKTIGEEKELIKNHPPIQGRIDKKGKFYLKGLNIDSVPRLFIIAWIGIIVLSGLLKFETLLNQFISNWQINLIAFLVIVILILIWVIISKHRGNS